MVICYTLLLPFLILVQLIIPIIQTIVTTVCSWVSTVIQVVIQVLTQVCSWLPWPFNLVCNWVVQLVTVVQTVWDYICNTIIQTIITIITYLLYLLIYIVQIICIVINIILSPIPYLFCRLGITAEKKLRVCIKVLTDEQGNSQVTNDAIKESIVAMQEIYSKCKIKVEVTGVEYIVQPQYLTTTDCGFGNIFTMWHLWFSQNACWCCNQITVYFVDDIVGSVTGCAIPGDNWCRVDSEVNVDPTIMAHEVGHLLNLWSHSNDPNNLMYAFTSGTSYNLTNHQCCTLRNSSFVTF